MAAKVADQAEIVLAADARQRPVVVDSRNRLHAPPIAVRQPHPVNALGAPDIRRAEPRNRNGFVSRQTAGHARRPQHFVAVLCKHPVGELMDVCQLLQRSFDAAVNAGDEFKLRFAEIGRDVRVRQRRTQ